MTDSNKAVLVKIKTGSPQPLGNGVSVREYPGQNSGYREIVGWCEENCEEKFTTYLYRTGANLEANYWQWSFNSLTDQAVFKLMWADHIVDPGKLLVGINHAY